MNRRVKKYYLRKYNDWRNKVSVRLNDLVPKYYELKSLGIIKGYDNDVLLGTVIRDVNTPGYGLNCVSSEVMLEILVEELFSLVYGMKGKKKMKYNERSIY